ncbi:hypothetical protein DAI22_10g101200 [Oryza sativa Japonica Group]|nr:hypothetical protein DAI22_10g101200 [Oryza sativa Japonica Group]
MGIESKPHTSRGQAQARCPRRVALGRRPVGASEGRQAAAFTLPRRPRWRGAPHRRRAGGRAGGGGSHRVRSAREDGGEAARRLTSRDGGLRVSRARACQSPRPRPPRGEGIPATASRRRAPPLSLSDAACAGRRRRVG